MVLCLLVMLLTDEDKKQYHGANGCDDDTVNGFEIGITFQFVPNNFDIIYYDGLTDPDN
jgi:hypothetical protein